MLFIEDFDDYTVGEIVIGDEDTKKVVRKFIGALLFKKHGKDLAFGSRLPSLFAEIGLVEIGMEASSMLWQGGRSGCIMMRANFEQNAPRNYQSRSDDRR